MTAIISSFMSMLLSLIMILGVPNTVISNFVALDAQARFRSAFPEAVAVEAEGCKIWLNVIGSEASEHTVVLLGGATNGGSHIIGLNTLATLLAQKYRVIVVEEPGHGFSGKLGKEWTNENVTKVIVDAVKQVDNGPYILAAFSLGGMYATYMIDKYPDLFEAYIGFDSNYADDTSPQFLPVDSDITTLENAFLRESGYGWIWAELNYPASGINAITDENEKKLAKLAKTIHSLNYYNEDYESEYNNWPVNYYEIRDMKYPAALPVMILNSGYNVDGYSYEYASRMKLVTNADIQMIRFVLGEHSFCTDNPGDTSTQINWFTANYLDGGYANNPADLTDLTWQEINGGAAIEITGCDDTAQGTLAIPEQINGKPVASIGAGAFAFCTRLTEIKLPAAVNFIGEKAFFNSDALRKVNIPDGVTEIPDFTFSYCTNLTDVSLPNTITSIGNAAFNRCLSLENINLSDSITSIGKVAFNYCLSLKDAKIPAGVTFLNAYLYYHCTSLTSATIPAQITGMYQCVFGQCANLENVTIEDGVGMLGSCTFMECPLIKGVDIPASVHEFYNPFFGCSGLESIDLPEGIPFIDGGAFYGCSSLKSIEIPDTVTAIQSSAFFGCTGLESIVLPDGLTDIEIGAFYGCMSLKSIDIPDGVAEIHSYAFENCTSLSDIKLPAGGRINEKAFYGCTSLEIVIIPNGTQRIDKQVFAGCTSLQFVEIPASVLLIQDGAFDGCPESLTISGFPISAAAFYALANGINFSIK